ncbi:His-Xaa-Ser system radical SAM maturase HxsC [Pseudoxanthomonas sp. PXM03]|uniref:His-Xaa-Ser system radical SAM maturase HxsC n=1 Tax=Pseudoxanthomonas sp. PXM03 TaxID=2769284 RepID=UPI00178521A7|nr:His-Xaa-Ser system radical SAM maturase HxsC [Pseudoxanthomonas sp. PXM03]MBD9437335.1 His-Xaa-Ser system radical SAM maturase HxsC [Pseudoxanthomonas sp. PXM03]
MHPQQAKATFSGLEHGYYKVAGLQEFAAGLYPLERMLLDLRHAPTADIDSLIALPWAGFMVDEADRVPPDRPWMRCETDQDWTSPGDVLELQPSASRAALRYRRGDNGNVLFATEQCNSYCLMCSQPPRVIDDYWRLEQLHALIDLIDKDERSLAVSGGEPMLLGDGLVEVIAHCQAALPQTHVHVLSNGRLAGEGGYARRFTGLHESLTWGIPLYGDTPLLHDYIVQRQGAFAQTLRGLYAMEQAKQRIEIRIVLVKDAVQRLESIARFIYRNLPFAEHVALMGVEPIGFAKAHHQSLWMDPIDMGPALSDSVQFLSSRNIAVSIYNLPLCTLSRELWSFSRQSISHWKQNYRPECQPCQVRQRCGGFFSWVTPDWLSRGVAPINQLEPA